MRAGNGGEGTRDQQPPPSLSFVTLRGEKRREDGDMAQSRVKEVEGGGGETGKGYEGSPPSFNPQIRSEEEVVVVVVVVIVSYPDAELQLGPGFPACSFSF